MEVHVNVSNSIIPMGGGGYIQMGFSSKVTYQEDGKTRASNRLELCFFC